MARRKIAVFTSHVYEPMAGLMQKGINAAAIDLGVKVIYFASFSDSYSSRNYANYTRYDEGDTVSFDIPDLNEFDGIIKIQTSFGDKAKERLNQRLQSTSLPIINIGGFDDKYRNICCDETRTFGELVEHLVVTHGCRNIYHLAGLPDKNFTWERIEAYKSILLKYDIPFDEDKIYFGNLWRDCGDAALDYFLDHCRKNGNTYPDAVVCANDYSAVGFVNACRARGIRIPEDIMVTGYDGLDDAVNGYPSITTSRQPFYNSGYQAVSTLLRIWNGEEVPYTITIMGEMFCNQSCGCKEKTADNIDDIRDRYLKRIKNTTNVAQSTTNLMLRVSTVTDLDECFREISRNARRDTGFRNMLLCMAPGWDKQRIVGDDFPTCDEEMTIVSGFIGDREVPVSTFRKKDILPADLMEDPEPYYIFTIHHLQYYMGYLIVSPDIDLREQESIQSWFVDLGMMLENRRIYNDLKNSIDRLEFLSTRDMLTGIYNRRGSEVFFRDYLKECYGNESGLAIMVFDMDDLKTINDNYGHPEGDYSIKTIAEALISASGEDEICTRAGGDEFVVIAKNYDEDKVRRYIDQVRGYISAKVSEDAKPYNVVVSVGSHLEIPSDDGGLRPMEVFEEYLKQADSRMYVEKREHKNAGHRDRSAGSNS